MNPGITEERSGAPRSYRVQSVIGRGSFGTVYRGELVGAGGFVRPVALKVLDPAFDGCPELGQRLRDEARMLGLVRHRAIVRVDELTRIDGRWAVVMERVDGVDLQRLLATDRGPDVMRAVPATAALEIVSEVAGALAAAHAARSPEGELLGLLHRDVKPANVLVTPNGEVKLVDFGVARAEFRGREARTGDLTFGSPGYLAPERRDLLDSPAGDVYGLGVLLLEALTGRAFGTAAPNPRRHAERVRAQVAASAAPPAALALAAAMVAHDAAARPSAREVERRARQLLRELDGPWLGDWVTAALESSSRGSEEPAVWVRGGASSPHLAPTAIPEADRARAPSPPPPRAAWPAVFAFGAMSWGLAVAAAAGAVAVLVAAW